LHAAVLKCTQKQATFKRSAVQYHPILYAKCGTPIPAHNIRVNVTSIATPITDTKCNDHIKCLDAKTNNHRELNSFAPHGLMWPRTIRLA